MHERERHAWKRTLHVHPAPWLTCGDAYSHVLGVEGGPE